MGLVLALTSIGALAARHRGVHSGTVPRPLPTPAPIASGPININAADASTLESLPRIGPALALGIVRNREAQGPFRTLEELDRVPGIGPAVIAVLRPLATAGSSTNVSSPSRDGRLHPRPRAR